MNPKSLEALIIDRGFGELSPEVAELLEAYLVLHPEAQEEVTRIEESLSVTGAVVSSRPELFQESRLSDRWERQGRVVPFQMTGLIRSIATVAAIAVVGVAGFLAGHQMREQPREAISRSLAAVETPSPWAKYRITDSGIEASIPNPTPEP